MVEGLLAVAALILFLATIFMPWVNRHRVLSLRDEVKDLRKTVRQLKTQIEMNEVKEGVKNAASVPVVSAKEEIIDKESLEPEIKGEKAQMETFEPIIKDKPEKTKPKKKKISFEQQFGARLPVWIGGVALALAGFYLVKYSIDNNLLSPSVRIFFGMLLGSGLIVAARWIREKGHIANEVRIAQSLSGAGIATLYVSIFAASNLYHLIPDIAGLIGMGAVTAIAVTLSLRHGAPVALLGMVGGFLTPALLSYGHHIPTPILFIYLYAIFAGLMAVIKQKRWWVLSLPSILGVFCWVIYWIAERFTPNDTIWVGLFLLAVSITIVAGSRQDFENSSAGEEKNKSNILNYIGLSGAIFLMGALTSKAGFGFMEWSLFAFLSLGGVVMAYFKDRLYGFVPWVTMAMSVVMMLDWRPVEINDFLAVIGVFGAMYIGLGYMLVWRAMRPSRWAGLAGATAVGYYMMSYYRFDQMRIDMTDHLWGIVALIAAGFFVHIAHKAYRYFDEQYEGRQNLLGVCALFATVFISIALTIELEREFLSVAVAAEILAISWIASRVNVADLRKIAILLFVAFGFLLVPQILLLFQLTAYSLFEAKLTLQNSVPIVDWPVFQLGIPAAMFIGASYYLRMRSDGKFVRALELACLGLVAVMGYYVNRHIFNTADEVMFKTAGFFERNVMTNILYVFALCCFYFGRKYQRIAISWGAMGLCFVALFRIIYFDLLQYNPFYEVGNLRGIVIANELVLPFLLPVLWSYVAAKEFKFLKMPQQKNILNGIMLLFVFLWLSLNVRFAYHGNSIPVVETSSAEIYTYSVVWLVLGISLLVAGVWKRDKMIRFASLAVMILTVGKVFLYDASELEGLLRVFSFFGLGVSLIGLSYFYTRFVFGKDEA